MGSRDITELLLAWSRGDRQAGEELLPRLYGELRRMAARYLAGERRDHTLQPTALVHEAFLRLVDQRQVEWQSRTHFFAVAATAMRRVLLDHARRRGAAKRAGSSTPITLVQGFDTRFEREVELLALDEALQRLEAMDRFKARLVELRFFAGLTIEETAGCLGCSTDTVDRHWRSARAWLVRALSPEPRHERPLS